jgi:transcriptional regulator with XRE-family HTH domain
MKTRISKRRLEKERSTIGLKVRALRQERRWNQVELARLLHLSQAQLSQIERGSASLTAEQLIEVLKLFNVSISDFVDQTPDPDQELQNALARLGATNLRTDNRLLPREQLTLAQDVVFEALASASPRLIASLAPVLVKNADNLNFTKLAIDLDAVGLRRRLYWAIENTIEALRLNPTTIPRASRIAAGRLQTTLSITRGYEQNVRDTPDLLDRTIRSVESVDDVRRRSSDISKRWNVISNIQPSDFLEALKASGAVA